MELAVGPFQEGGLMPNPFPGMDPYLEGDLWTTVHTDLCAEIARQLRLRDVGGIIVCDFIDMETRASRDKVLQELRTHLGREMHQIDAILSRRKSSQERLD